MYELYIGNKNYSSWSLRPWVLMRTLGIAFTEHLAPFDPGTSWAKFRAFSPSGKVPCLVDGATVVWDSMGIAEYLAERHAGAWPEEGPARAWARCAAAEMHSGFGALRQRCSMNCGLRVRLDAITPDLQRDLDRIDELWSEGLQRFGGPFLAGPSFTAADAFYAPVAFRVRTYGLPLSGASAAYARELLAMPSMRQWDDEAIAEPWRDNEHEVEAMQGATLIEDLRKAP
ncbi:MAG: glutathione S-transferase family protein [Steroidobacteraceae bacterium]|nr:glutathione S-transferase family protein [Steroidobacteraceae bacterium]